MTTGGLRIFLPERRFRYGPRVPLTAALIDDHQVFRDGLKRLFELNGSPSVVGEASGVPEALAVVRATRPDIVVLDLVLSGASGIEVALRLLQENPSQRILFLTMVKDRAQVADALDTGALGYATKDQSAQDLLEAVRTVGAGQPYLAPSLVAERGRGKVHIGLLTSRERQVFDLTIRGLTARDIGEQLSISARTVETHRVRILRKLDAHSATDLVRIAARAGILS